MHRRVILVALSGAVLVALTPPNALAVARRAGMGGVVLPGWGWEHQNPAFRGLSVDDAGRAIPLPLGAVAGFLADTEGMDGFEAAYTRIKAAYPFFEVELRPETDLSSDIQIDVGEDYLVIDLGEGRSAVPDGPVQTDIEHSIEWVGATVGPVFFGVSTILSSDGVVNLDEDLRHILQTGGEFDPAEVYEGDLDNTAQVAGAFEVGTRFQVGTLGEGTDSPWALFAAVSGKGLVGLGYADAHVDGFFRTGEPIFNENDPLEATYVADIRYNQGVGLGYSSDVGLAASAGPWLLGVSVVNAVSQMYWDLQRRVDVLDEDGNTITTRYEDPVKATSELPRTWVASAAWRRPSLLVAADVRLDPAGVEWHGGLERRFGLLAARTGLSWEEDHGVQGAVGAGIGRRFSFDVSLRTHPRLYSEGRGLLLGASVGVPF